MGCSEAQLAANRANAAKSTGPKTVEGKARSRRNSLRHGLTGAGIVLPHEDEAAIEARFAEFEADLQPQGGVDRFLVRRAAFLSVRLDRAALHEAACLSATIRNLDEDEDEAAAEIDVEGGVEALFAALLARPATARQEALDEPDGADRLIMAMSVLQRDLQTPDPAAWTSGHSRLLEPLLGHDPAGLPARSRLLSDVVLGDDSQLRAAETAQLDLLGKQRWAAERLTRLIDGEIEQLRVHRSLQPPIPPRPALASVAHRALVDTSPEAMLARRYEATAERGLFRTLTEIRRVQATRAAAATALAVEPTRLAAELGSSGRPPMGSSGRPPRSAGSPPSVPTPAPVFGDFGLDHATPRPARRLEPVITGRPPTG